MSGLRPVSLAAFDAFSLPPLAGEAARRADGGFVATLPPSAFGTSPRCTGGGTAWLPPLLAGAGGGGGDACAAPSASTTAITAPCSTLSPTLTLTSLITPAALAGTSIV